MIKKRAWHVKIELSLFTELIAEICQQYGSEIMAPIYNLNNFLESKKEI